MERSGFNKALRTVLWFILLSLSSGLWMGCFRGAGILGNPTRHRLSPQSGRTERSGAGRKGLGAGSGHIGEADALGLTAADDAEWCNPSELQMFKSTGNCSEDIIIDLFPNAPCPRQVDRSRLQLSNQHRHSRRQQGHFPSRRSTLERTQDTERSTALVQDQQQQRRWTPPPPQNLLR